MFKKISKIFFVFTLLFALSTMSACQEVEQKGSVPSQLFLQISGDASTSINISYTTVNDVETKVMIEDEKSNRQTFTGRPYSGYFKTLGKYFHNISLTGLKENTLYLYTAGSEKNFQKGQFKTGSSKEDFTFAYMSDPQTNNTLADNALGSVMKSIQNINDLSFLYLAGDLTNNAMEEAEWDGLFSTSFENKGLYPNAGKELFSNFPIAVAQGNHDNKNFYKHLMVPSANTKVQENVYSFVYGPARFIILNLENPSTYDAQEEFLRQEVKKANELHQWTIVGTHKAIYSGGSHLVNSDVIKARKQFSPVFDELGVSLVLQGHDHVYSRGFVNGLGQKIADVANNETLHQPSSPLYVVAGTSSATKWYQSTPYEVSEGDPLIKDYAFLDVNSSKNEKFEMQTYCKVNVTSTSIILSTYVSQYDTKKNEISIPEYLYDQVTITR